MGRKATSLKNKATHPVALPHDGPIFKIYDQSTLESTGESIALTTKNEDIQQALHLLSTSEISMNGSSFPELARKLCHSLRTAGTAKEQLQALQVFRNSLLNLYSKQKQAEESGSDTPASNQDLSLQRGLFRLLLEWSLSSQTSVPLQRVVQSNLNHLNLSLTAKDGISTQVLQTLWLSTSDWRNPLHSLDIAVNASLLVHHLQTKLFTECMTFLYNHWISTFLQKSEHEGTSTVSTNDVQNGLIVAGILKTLLQPGQRDSQSEIPFPESFEMAVLALMKCPSMPDQAYSTLGIVFGRIKFHPFCSNDGLQPRVKLALAILDDLQQTNSQVDQQSQIQQLSPLSKISIVQGVAAALDPETLTTAVHTGLDASVSPLESCWMYSLVSAKVATDPLVRWAALRGLSTLASRWKQYLQQEQKEPSTAEANEESSRAIHSHMDALIQDTLEIVLQAWENPPLRKLGTAIPGIFKTLVELLPTQERPDLCRIVIAQPVNRKGRYLALEILLPYFPPGDTGLQLASLLDGIGDRGPNTGVIADLWAKLLKHAWDTRPSDDLNNSCQEWVASWAPPLSLALLNGELKRRKQVASYCFIRLIDLLKQNESLEPMLSQSLERLFEAISSNEDAAEANVKDPIWSNSNRVLWAQLEFAKQVHAQKVLTAGLKVLVNKYIPSQRLKIALTHSSEPIRLAAYQSLEFLVIKSYGQSVREEAKLWQSCLPYSIRSSESREFISSILQYLTVFLDRFSIFASASDSTNSQAAKAFQYFVSNFLIDDLVLRHGGYPGTIASKEGFSLALLERLLAYLKQDRTFISNTGGSQNNQIFNRRRSTIEEQFLSDLLEKMISQEVFGTILALMHSVWDSTRSTSFRLLSKIAETAKSKQIQLPKELRCDWKPLFARGLYLASSPRQRESDTGSRILAFLYLSTDNIIEQVSFLQDLEELLVSRLAAMKESLENAMNGKDGDLDHTGLPLAHGIVHAIFLILDHEKVAGKVGSRKTPISPGMPKVHENMIPLFCEALELSLTVVADIREGEVLEGMEESLQSEGKMTNATPLNVNTGAIGANGTFSKLSSTDTNEGRNERLIQRIVIGTWLSTKETCAAMSAGLTTEGFNASIDLINACGSRLISTLVSLKHAGAAFAARDSLQDIATACFKSKSANIRGVPLKWATRLLYEISSKEKVRDSTLRRSTGYALGFLALMRAELNARVGSHELCQMVLKSIIKFSLPPEGQMSQAFQKLSIQNLDDTGAPRDLFFAASKERGKFFLSNIEYEGRCRIHALNILRLIILDAPLTNVVTPFIGDAMISALLGYDDSAWDVRNSSTMVFSASMLRVVDADKNASNKDKTSSQAITLTELLRRYPSLTQFLPAMMEKCLMEQEKQVNSQLFPILLLLSRIQPIAQSGGSAARLASEYPFLVFRSIGNKHHAIRAAAARSLANLCSEEKEGKGSSLTILSMCLEILDEVFDRSTRNWNMVDGALAVIEALCDKSKNCKLRLLEGDALNMLQRIVLSVESCPPTCISFACNALLSIPSTRNSRNVDNFLEVTRTPQLSLVIGGSLAYASAARGIIKEIEKAIWRPTSRQSLETHATILGEVLSSDVIDVRLPAIKAFKKTIYHHIDVLLEARDPPIPSSLILETVALQLLSSLEKELERDTIMADKVGAHIPSLRRLSRCFLECVDSQRIDSTFLKKERNRIWSISVGMIKKEKFMTLRANEDGNGETFLAGNAVEMMSSVIACTLDSDEEIELDRLRNFNTVLGYLNQHDASWRSRYSAARSIETSGVLKSKRLTPEVKHDMLEAVLDMLQDSDPDVQSCATKIAASSLGKDPTRTILPFPALCRLHEFVYRSRDESLSDSKLMQSLLKKLLENVKGIDATIDSLSKEFKLTRLATTDLSSLTNISTTRRIFEEEEANPNQERALHNQLIVQSMLILAGVRWDNASIETQCEEVFSTLDSVLRLLSASIEQGGGIIHDLSRSTKVFGPLHGLIGAAAACLYLGCNGTGTAVTQVSDLAKKIVSSRDLTIIHPEIVRELQILSVMSKKDDQSRRALEDSLFLLERKLDAMPV